MSIDTDTQFEEVGIKAVAKEGDGWTVQREDGWSFYVPPSPVTPKPGMLARFYGRGIGYIVRGLTLGGVVVFYRSEAEDDAKRKRECEDRERERRYDFEKNRSNMDKRYAALPDVFRERIGRFRQNNPDFRWEFEDYELFCCEQAVAIARTSLVNVGAEWARGPGGDLPAIKSMRMATEWVDAWAKKSWKDQKKAMPELSDKHSGNTFGCAVALARQYLAGPSNVSKIVGALSPLVGSEAYGDIPRTE
jgi:hypothetical protein